MSEPRLTAASRALLTYGTLDLAPTAPRVNSFAEVLEGIEAAARADALAEVRAGVEGLRLIEPNEPDHPGPYYDGWHDALDALTGQEYAATPPAEVAPEP